jgi:hypothetical protein
VQRKMCAWLSSEVYTNALGVIGSQKKEPPALAGGGSVAFQRDRDVLDPVE